MSVVCQRGIPDLILKGGYEEYKYETQVYEDYEKFNGNHLLLVVSNVYDLDLEDFLTRNEEFDIILKERFMDCDCNIVDDVDRVIPNVKRVMFKKICRTEETYVCNYMYIFGKENTTIEECERMIKRYENKIKDDSLTYLSTSINGIKHSIYKLKDEVEKTLVKVELGKPIIHGDNIEIPIFANGKEIKIIKGIINKDGTIKRLS